MKKVEIAEIDKIEVKKDDIIIIKDPDDNFDYSGFKELPYNNLIVHLVGEATLKVIDEKEMNQAGWFKKGDFDIVTDIIHIRKGLEVINAGCYNDLGLYNPKVLLEKAIELEGKLIGK